MRIITERRLREFWQTNQNAENAMREWISVVRLANWNNLADVHATFNSIDFHKNMLIFNVGGNKFRIIAKVEYQKHLVFIKFVGTHNQYDNHKAWCDCGK